VVTTQSPATTNWTGADIGSVGAAGSTASSGGTITVTGSGTDIWGTADSFQFASQSITGDGSITARVLSQTQPSSWSKAGVMFRETSAPGSKFAAVVITPAHGSLTEARTSTGGTAAGITGPTVKAPYWVRMVRAGNLLTGYLSADGNTWTSAGSFTVSMSATVSVGLAVTSHLRGSLSTVVFDNVSLNAAQSVPPASVSVAPRIATLTLGSTQQFTATVAGGASVTWTVDGETGGDGTVGSIGQTGLYTAGTAVGTHTIVATNASDSTQSATAVVAVTDLAGIYTYHNDLSRDGANIQEYALTKSNVNTARFGKLAACAVDGTIAGQPLWVANLVVNGTRRNAVFVATEHDGLFAFDADASPCVKLWAVSLLDGGHGGTSGETAVPYTLIGDAGGDIQPEVGVTGTPVIDPTAGILYVISKSVDSAHSSYFQRLHAIDLLTGNEKSGSPVTISASYPGTGDDGSTVAFNARKENQRVGLTLTNGVVYAAWGAHEDIGPWYGWVIGYHYDGVALTQTSVINVAPNSQEAGIWMGGGAPSVDSGGNLYVITGNGNFDATSTTAPNNDYGDSLLQLTPALAVSQWFTPSDQLTDNQNDKDFGSGGAALLADLPAGNTVTHALICGGKDHSVFVLNRDLLGGFGDAAAVQKIDFGSSIFGTGAFWNNTFYLAGLDHPLQAYQLNTSTAQFSRSSASAHSYGFPGATPTVSASGTQNGIVWSLETGRYCTSQARGCGPAVLYAHDASNLATELWNSSLVPADAAGNAVKFSVPTVANGKVYVGTRGNNAGGAASSTSIPGELDIYGLKP
jgi:regulation of enolase protein 1 (concanavalin A-like superfamily)